VVLGYILGVELDYGLIGTWLAMVIEWGIRGLLFLWRFKGEKWVHRLV
jgi:Na+-driven multidrug efflux pump